MNIPRKKWTVWGAAVFCVPLLFAGCHPALEYQETTIYAMDTLLQFDILASGDSDIGEQMRAEVERVDRLLSATNLDSELYQLNHREASSSTASEELAGILSDCLAISRQTDGALNIALYPVTQAWGFVSGDYHVPDATVLSDAMEKIHWEDMQVEGTQIQLPEGMELDLGAVGKGYLTDCCVEILRDNQVESALLDLGGNVYAYGRKEDGTSWRIGIQMPFQDSLAGSLTVEDEAVVTSGTYQRYFEEDGQRYHHILDSETGYPVENGLESVTIVTENGFLADALSTSFFVMGLEKSTAFWQEQFPDVGVVWITSQGEVYCTKNLEERFQPSDGVECQIIGEA